MSQALVPEGILGIEQRSLRGRRYKVNWNYIVAWRFSPARKVPTRPGRALALLLEHISKCMYTTSI